MTRELEKIFFSEKVEIFSPFEQLVEMVPDRRFVPMKKGLCYDSEVNGCWLEICSQNPKRVYFSLIGLMNVPVYF
jgi:hypothetical protein